MPHPPVKEYEAIWDTGAEMSSISHRVIRELGLMPVGMAKNYTAAGEIDVHIYVVNVQLPMGVAFAQLPVTGNDLGDVDMLIGMDVISKGDFAVTNVGGVTTFSFRIPSQETIDYVEQDNQANAKAQLVADALKHKKVGRNDPCPCGSGKKYKNCHGKNH
ncbi:MAG: SEC-C domain-containing protein [Muribaculaceae bacterium]|nr:SEC-C domain-containing protein [Muribaculaceae bacterium]